MVEAEAKSLGVIAALDHRPAHGYARFPRPTQPIPD